ncbi:hepatocyte growth factor-regulated tyrosine kinase substrate isoform X2 [Teleopsis dalmanni]|uniref:hepatocyte growth factor-regulated tyrosine kinase substrate isoform X2 n=1 Tax=Teleopsis dalmanni TaxID=139649 RepID=UPI0018CED043|nr:hepatocyte growth factor-regulated tyrosine kinase substrate isoform X2 [Teleopsis dalmanni]
MSSEEEIIFEEEDTMTILKTKGHSFPEIKEADAMFTADTAPNWADGKVCHRCRKEFSVLIRKHHCRNCGQVFCGDCTAKQCPLPKYGIEKDVRVCDVCYTALQRPQGKQLSRTTDSELPAEYVNSSLAQQVQTPPRKTEQELKEEEELNLAIALSQSEAEQKKQQQQHQTFNATAYRLQQRSPSPEPTVLQQEETNPDLAKYLNRNYWEHRKVSDSPVASPSAPSPMPTPQPQLQPMLQKNADEAQLDEFVANMRNQVQNFVNRMKSNSSRGRSITNDSFVQSLFITLTSLHSQQLSYIKEMDDKRMWYEQLQDKLGQIKDSRAALDVLRQEHAEKMRRIAEEQELQRQIQMAQKLEIMRKKKQEYLQYSQQLALQRIQEQEREMQMRQEQQKAQYLMGQTAFPFIASGGVNNSGVHSSPSHQLNNAYNTYGFNPNSPGPMASGQFNLSQQMPTSMAASGGMTTATSGVTLPGATRPTPLPGMYTGNMLPNSNQHAGMMLPSMPSMPGGMLPTNGNMMPSGAVGMGIMGEHAFQGQANSFPQGLLQTQQQQQQQQHVANNQQQQHVANNQQQQHVANNQQQNVQPSHQNPQLAHVMLQHQNVIQTQPPIATPPNQMPPAPVGGGIAPQTNTANAQVQAIAAAPAPPQTELEPVSAAVPEEPATAELISFD